MWIYLILLILIVFVLYVFLTFNSLIKLKNKVDEAFSVMDVYLKKRWDLIPNIVETVRGYASYEKKTIEDIIKHRNKIYDKMNIDEKFGTNKKIEEDLTKILAFKEAYPDLKANENYINLSKQLEKIEEDIANSRKYYNAVVRMYNDKIEMFPSNIIAKLFNFQKKKMFEINRDEKENIEVNL